MPPEEAKDGLDKEWRLDEAPVEKMRQAVEMADVVAFEFETCVVVRTRPQHEFDVAEGVAKHAVPAVLKALRLPRMLELLVAVEHVEQADVHRPHVEGRDFRLELQGWLHPFFDAHIRARRRW